MPFLQPTRGMDSRRISRLDGNTVIIGRSARRCQIVLDHFAVSREHARIDFTADGATITDLNSRNGVMVNGKTMSPGLAGKRVLAPGDKIAIACFEFAYLDEPPSDSVVIVPDETLLNAAVSTITDPRTAPDDSSGERRGKLTMLLEVIAELSTSWDVADVLPKIMDSLLRVFRQTTSGYVLLRDAQNQLIPVVDRRRDRQSPIQVRQSVIERLTSLRGAVLASDVSGVFPAASEVNTSPVMCAPLLDQQGSVLGLIQLEASPPDGFGPDDLEVLDAVARHLAVVMANTELNARVIRSQQQQYESQFQSLLEASIQGLAIHRDFHPLFVNEAWARLHGYSVDDVLAMESLLPLTAQEDQAAVESQVQARLSPGQTARRLSEKGSDPWEAGAAGEGQTPARTGAQRFESRQLHRDGSIVWVENFISVVQFGGAPAILCALIDRTEQKRAEQELKAMHAELERRIAARTEELQQVNRTLQEEITERSRTTLALQRSQALYKSLVDHLPICVVRKSHDGKFQFVNRAFTDLFGWKLDDVRDKTDFDLFPRPVAQKYRHDDEAVMQSGELLDITETVLIPSGRQLFIRTWKTPIRDLAGHVTGIQLLFWDITAARETEEQRNRYARELERSNRELERFAYTVAHDLHVPLRTTRGFCQLLNDHCAASLDDEARECLAAILDGTQRMGRLLDDLLQYSRVQVSDKPSQPASCERALEEALTNLKAQVTESQAVVTHDPLPTVIGDSSQLMRLFQNLLANAIVYRSEAPPRIHVGVEELADCWRFYVADNGIGIAPQFFERIFDVFQRLHAEHERSGSGIGLSICKRIAERHGGKMWVESTPGKGSRFYFTIAKQLAR